MKINETNVTKTNFVVTAENSLINVFDPTKPVLICENLNPDYKNLFQNANCMLIQLLTDRNALNQVIEILEQLGLDRTVSQLLHVQAANQIAIDLVNNGCVETAKRIVKKP